MGVVQKILGKAEFKDSKSEYFMIEFNKNNWIMYCVVFIADEDIDTTCSIP